VANSKYINLCLLSVWPASAAYEFFIQSKIAKTKSHPNFTGQVVVVHGNGKSQLKGSSETEITEIKSSSLISPSETGNRTDLVCAATTCEDGHQKSPMTTSSSSHNDEFSPAGGTPPPPTAASTLLWQRQRPVAVKSKSRHEHNQCKYRTGKWGRNERLLFLKGLRVYGWGRWKEIGGTYLTTR
jgi:hypothetical protein